MLLRQIEYFCAVCRTGSFTRAAEESYVSQSAISQQVKALEAELGTQLLDRRGRSFSLTAAGEHYYRKASAILRELEDLRFETQGIAGGWPTRLAVGYLGRYEGWEVQGALAAFAARHPRIDVDVTSGSHDDLYRALEDGSLDIAFSDRHRTLSDSYENRFLFTGYDSIELSEIDPLSNHASLGIKDLAGKTCILIASSQMEDAERTFHRDMMGFDCDFRFVGSREEGRMLVAGNHGFMPVETREERAATGSIVRSIPLVGANGRRLSHDYYAFWPKRRTSPLVEEFAEILSGLFE